MLATTRVPRSNGVIVTKNQKERKEAGSKRYNLLLIIIISVVITRQLTVLTLFHSCDGSFVSFQDTLGLSPTSFYGDYFNRAPNNGQSSDGDARAVGDSRASRQKESQKEHPQYIFRDPIPSRAWKPLGPDDEFPCHPPGAKERKALMAVTPSHEGLLFLRPHKVGSTTMNNIVLRLGHNRGKARSSEVVDRSARAAEWKNPPRCHMRTMHGDALSMEYHKRNKKKSYLFSLTRDPTKRFISEFFHFIVTHGHVEPTDANFINYAMHENALNPLIRDLTMDPKLWDRMQDDMEHHLRKLSTKKNSGYFRKHKARRNLPRNHHLVNYTVVVEEILEAYDFIAVTERMDESLVAFKLLLGLDVEEILYATAASRASGSFSNGPKEEPCVYIIPSFLTDGMKQYFYDYQYNEAWRIFSYGDALLHRAAEASLDRTIHEVFGKERFEKELEEFRNAKAYAQAICSEEPDLIVGMCDDSGRRIPIENRTCYIWAEGCDQKCLNERVPNKIPQEVLDGTLRYGDDNDAERVEGTKPLQVFDIDPNQGKVAKFVENFKNHMTPDTHTKNPPKKQRPNNERKEVHKTSPNNLRKQAATWHHHPNCGFDNIERTPKGIGTHKFKAGLYGIKFTVFQKAKYTEYICQSRYYIIKYLLRVLSDVALQANVKMVPGYGTLLSYHRYQDAMPWDLDGDLYLIEKDMDTLVRLVESRKIMTPDDVAFVWRKKPQTKSCDHTLGLFHRKTGFYIDLMRLEQANGFVNHHTYMILETSYFPLKPCLIDDIPFSCPNNILHFIGPPGRNYSWETLSLHELLKPCPYYSLIHGKAYDSIKTTEFQDIFGRYLDPDFEWPSNHVLM